MLASRANPPTLEVLLQRRKFRQANVSSLRAAT
jgi:hypothetical protein